MPGDPEPYRQLLDRVAVLDLEAAFAAPRGDRTCAAACVARWLDGARAWLAHEGPGMRAFRAHEPSALEWLDRFVAPAREHPLPDSLAIDWAEGPFEMLVAPGLLTNHDALDRHGWYRGGLRVAASATVDFLRTVVLRTGPDRIADVPGRPFEPAHPDPRAAFARGLLRQCAGHVIRDALDTAHTHPLLTNPYEPELALLERGLWPLGIDGDICRVFRYSPVVRVCPAWLPYFTE